MNTKERLSWIEEKEWKKGKVMSDRSYYRIYLGQGHKYVAKCHKEGFVGIDFGIHQDVTNDLCKNWNDFSKKLTPIYSKNHPNKSKISAGQAFSHLWTIGKDFKIGDIVLSKRQGGDYLVGEVVGDYFYCDKEYLPHRRNVKWYSQTISKDDMSGELQRLAGNPGTIRDLTKYSKELENLTKGEKFNLLKSMDEQIENPSYFAMEAHLEDFLICNWKQTALGKKYDIWEDEGEVSGQQFRTDTGYIDILAISKDKREILVIELKKGRASDFVVGQIQRYMGYMKDEIAEDGQVVKGAIIALENDKSIKRALSVTSNIEFYRYEVKFDLVK